MTFYVWGYGSMYVCVCFCLLYTNESFLVFWEYGDDLASGFRRNSFLNIELNHLVDLSLTMLVVFPERESAVSFDWTLSFCCCCCFFSSLLLFLFWFSSAGILFFFSLLFLRIIKVIFRCDTNLLYAFQFAQGQLQHQLTSNRQPPLKAEKVFKKKCNELF